MSITTSEMTPADIRACTGGNDGFGFGGNGGWFWIIVLFLFAFNGGGWGGGNWGGGGSTGAAENYVLASDFATIQRQLSDGFGGVEKGIDTIRNGICDLGYTNQTLHNQTNMNVMQTGFGLQTAINGVGTQMAQCCCDIRGDLAGVNYNMANQANMLSRDVERGFCDTQYRDAQNTNALMQAGHSDADRIIARLDAMENARKDERIAQLQTDNTALKFQISQEGQSRWLYEQLGPKCPQAAYVVQPPQQVTFPTNCCGGVNYANYNGGCGCG